MHFIIGLGLGTLIGAIITYFYTKASQTEKHKIIENQFIKISAEKELQVQQLVELQDIHQNLKQEYLALTKKIKNILLKSLNFQQKMKASTK